MAEGMVQLNETTVGFEARPDGVPSAPAVLVVHEIVGLDDYIKEVTRAFAANGYVGLVVDLFEGETALGREDGTPLREKVTPEVLKAKMGAGASYLRSQTYCSGRIGVVGFCMGGGFSLLTACLLPDEIQACSIFYGRMANLELLQRLRCPVVGNFGEEDRGITTWVQEEFKPEMERLGKQLNIKVYPGAPHGFHKDTNPTSYRPEAAKDAFQRTLDLFGEALGKPEAVQA